MKVYADKEHLAKHKDPEGNDTPFTLADAGLIGAYNFGERAQAAEFRQSAEFFDMAMERTVGLLKEKGITIHNTEHLLEILNADPETHPKEFEMAHDIRKILWEDLANIREEALEISKTAEETGSR